LKRLESDTEDRELCTESYEMLVVTDYLILLKLLGHILKNANNARYL